MPSKIVDLIQKKRLGEELDETEIKDFITMAAAHTIGDAQIGAMLMAIAIQRLTERETFYLTKSMANSGYVFNWDDAVCDKHSTGGVGDKISIPLAPALASLGLKVPMFSGRALGFTGGTLDKLESIPGFNVCYSLEELKEIIRKCGVFIAGTTREICPGDNTLYSIRNVTATLDCDELIVGSILSKKFAAGVKNFVLDVKVGSAAFFQTEADAIPFARKMKSNARLLGMNLDCVLTRMDDPIGNYVGNSLEIEESIQVLRGMGSDDVKELVKILGGHVVALSGLARDPEAGADMIQTVLADGSALKKFEEMIICQGVKPADARELCHGDYRKVLGTSKYNTIIVAEESGWVTSIDGKAIALEVKDLEIDHKLNSERLDHLAGVVLLVQSGSYVSAGDGWMQVFHNKTLTEEAKLALKNALTISSIQPLPASSRKIMVI